MKILYYQWNAYNGKDVAEVFRAQGHTVDAIAGDVSDAIDNPAFAGRFAKALQIAKENAGLTSGRGAYDMVFSVDYFPALSEICKRCATPYVSWSCDAGLTSMYHRSVYNDCNYIFLFDKADYLEFREKGLRHLHYLPLAPNTERMERVLGGKKDAGDDGGFSGQSKQLTADISFVGTLYEKNKYDTLAETFPPYLRGYLDAVIEAQCNVSGGSLIDRLLTDDILKRIAENYRLERMEGSESDVATFFSRSVLGYKVARKERLAALAALGRAFGKERNVSLYTNESVPYTLLEEAPALRVRGGVDYETELPLVFRDSKINLNFTIPNIESGVPLRVWDILASGGFCLTNDRPELHELFRVGEELVVFDGVEDMVQKAAYYLAHEEERREIAARGRERALRNDLKLRLEELLSYVL